MKVAVHITPNASKNQVVSINEKGEYKIKVQAPPVDGAANKCLVKYLAGLIGVPKSGIHIIRGETSRHKLLEIESDTRIFEKLMKEEL